MHGAALKAIDTYARIGTETGVAAADPHKLIMMLFEGAQLAIADARKHMERRNVAARGESISKAISIIDSGLRASLDMKVGGELAGRLSSLYEYMVQRLLWANFKVDIEALDEVSRLLGEIGGAWAQIGRKPDAGAPAAATGTTSRA